MILGEKGSAPSRVTVFDPVLSIAAIICEISSEVIWWPSSIHSSASCTHQAACQRLGAKT